MIEAMNNLRNGKLEAAFRPADDDGLFSFELVGTLTADFMGEPSGRVTGRIAGGVLVAEGEPGPDGTVYGFDGELRDAVIDPETGKVSGDIMGVFMNSPVNALLMGVFSGEFLK
ncbi:MAG: hypothetical protein IJJ20_06680 [Thermoguttaceae bacterium]|nr:hypothetical protein [Thermoguttaceae bacterium]